MSLDELENLVESEPQNPAGDRPLIVVIDDDPSIRGSLTTVLKDRYAVLTCRDGIEGVKAVDDRVSCVILDVKMPTHDGFWVCKHLRKRDPDLPIIFHSGYQDLREPHEAMNEFRAFGYIVKGGPLSTLLSMIAGAVRQSERVRAKRATVLQLRQAREELQSISGHVSVSEPKLSDIPPPRRK